MDPNARKALNLIRRCVASGRYRVLAHFTQRLDERGLFWPDVQALLDAPTDVREGGPEPWGRPKWVVGGRCTTGDALELVCVLDEDERGRVTVFITAY